ncbi:hypothetical protein [Eubacterium barkeri]|uniref:Thioredoxin domain-containing protein n=1 Tax=Eubacterium barkeri TaxID=1528 RepID=A0A1H3CCE1_EUBBA|nr:hypothetical protein [Eubacterium barkeri]SDX51710.1 hypothetical protein SAMN04488579_10344 [Eubacterium barkeri]
MPSEKRKKPVTFARTCCGVSLDARERQKGVNGVLVLGRPSAPYDRLCQVVQQALVQLDAEPAKCQDDPKLLEVYGIITPPAVLCNGRLILCGEDGTSCDLEELLKTALGI